MTVKKFLSKHDLFSACFGGSPALCCLHQRYLTHTPPTQAHLLISTGTLKKADHIKERRGDSFSSKMVPGSHWDLL